MRKPLPWPALFPPFAYRIETATHSLSRGRCPSTAGLSHPTSRLAHAPCRSSCRSSFQPQLSWDCSAVALFAPILPATAGHWGTDSLRDFDRRAQWRADNALPSAAARKPKLSAGPRGRLRSTPQPTTTAVRTGSDNSIAGVARTRNIRRPVDLPGPLWGLTANRGIWVGAALARSALCQLDRPDAS